MNLNEFVEKVASIPDIEWFVLAGEIRGEKKDDVRWKDHGCPIVLLYNHITGDRALNGEYQGAAARIGLDRELGQAIACAADNYFDEYSYPLDGDGSVEYPPKQIRHVLLDRLVEGDER